jgi:drug/metabolite transporter (DMT)-like permease
MGIALGLAAAVSWGLADYSAAITSRRIGSVRVVLGFHLLATVIVALAVLASGEAGRLGDADPLDFALLGAVGCGSYLAFYRALAIGPISVVSPIVSGYAAVTVVLAVALLGDRPSPAATLAIIVAMSGVVLASSDLAQIRSQHRPPLAGIMFALLAMALLGGFVFGVAYHSEELGWLVPIFLARACTTIFLLLAAVPARALDLPDRSPGLLGTIVLLALLDTGGYVAFNLGIRHADTSIVATASAPYAVIPIVMGVAVLHERPARVQWLGVALVLGGLVLLGVVY